MCVCVHERDTGRERERIVANKPKYQSESIQATWHNFFNIAKIKYHKHMLVAIIITNCTHLHYCSTAGA